LHSGRTARGSTRTPISRPCASTGATWPAAREPHCCYWCFCASSSSSCSAANISEVSVGPFKLTESAVLLPAIPVAITYLFQESLYALDLAERLTDLHNEVITEVYPAVEKADLELPLMAMTPSLWGENRWIQYGFDRQSPAIKVWNSSGALLGVGLVLGALAFLVHAYVELIQRSNTVLTWVGLTISLILVIRAVSLFVSPRGDE
jgi:hypothetical protein